MSRNHFVVAAFTALIIASADVCSVLSNNPPVGTEVVVPGQALLTDDPRHPETVQIQVRVTAQIEVSPFPILSVRNATPQQSRRLSEALERFRSAGLLLPDLVVEFSADTEPCGGNMGLFQPRSSSWRIVICTGLDAVYEHELAHAWELANVNDETRRRFMDHRGYASWNDQALPWNERGVEGAAFVIQQGLIDLPLPPTLSAENHSRLVAYTILTEKPAPRLLAWIGLDAGRTQTTDYASD